MFVGFKIHVFQKITAVSMSHDSETN